MAGLFCCENNLYAMGTALSRSESETNLAYKAASYEEPAWSVDGMDVLEVEHAAHRAVAEIRGGGGPVFLELRTFRFRGHSMYDPERYRSKGEVDTWRQRDPITVLSAQLAAADLLVDGDVDAIDAEVGAEIDDAIAFAEAGTSRSRTSPGSSTASARHDDDLPRSDARGHPRRDDP